MTCPVSPFCPTHHRVQCVTSQETANSSPRTFHMRLILFLISPQTHARRRSRQLQAQLSSVPPFRSSNYQMKEGPVTHKSDYDERDVCLVCPPKKGQRFESLALPFGHLRAIDYTKKNTMTHKNFLEPLLPSISLYIQNPIPSHIREIKGFLDLGQMICFLFLLDEISF